MKKLFANNISKEKRETILGWVMVSPFLIGFVFLTAIPMIASFVISFSEWDMLSNPEWIGFDNYKKLFFEDELALHSLNITILFTIVSIPLNILFGLALAMLLNTSIRGLAIFRTIYYLPAILSGVAVALMWRWIFSTEFGLLNALLDIIGIEGPAWLTDRIWVLPSFVIMRLWSVGGGMIIYLAGLQSIPTNLYEAANIDGANWWHKTRFITLPLLSPTIFFQLIVGFIFSMQIFTEAFIMTNGGPADASLFYLLYLYRQAFQYFDMGYASALAWVLFVVILFLTIVMFKTSRFWVYYEAETRKT
tara:strand:+ start:1784 stop:2701 length:918 start_codon:yes stop_codon:yes gene_type:complete